eukprot:12929688-Prorocentrum_lima.AAC.1
MDFGNCSRHLCCSQADKSCEPTLRFGLSTSLMDARHGLKTQLRNHTGGPRSSMEPDKTARLRSPQLAVAKQAKSLLPWPRITPSQPVAGPIQLYAADPY